MAVRPPRRGPSSASAATSSGLSAQALHVIITGPAPGMDLRYRGQAPSSTSRNDRAISVSTADILVTAILSYALGCLSFAYYAVRIATGQDIRELETGTAGARNVARVLGRPAAFAVMAGDIAKGAALMTHGWILLRPRSSVWIAKAMALDVEGQLIAMTLVIAGHIWPLQLGFRGGKGLASGFGALVAVMPLVALGATAVNAGLSLVLRSLTAGTLLATALTPILAAILGQGIRAAALLALPVGIILVSHRENISRLIRERKTGP